MKSLLFIVSAIAVFAGAVSQCNYDPIPECRRRDFNPNYIQYIGNPCDSNTFYQCERTGTGLVAHLQRCPRCLDWADDTRLCSVRNNIMCPPQTPSTEIVTHDSVYCYRTSINSTGIYIYQCRDTASHISYYRRIFDHDVLMSCPPGTYFDFNECWCMYCYAGGPCAGGSSPPVFTLDFDNKASQKGIYFMIDSSARVTSAGQTGKALVFNGRSTNIAVPFFQNNGFTQFKFDGYFNRDSSGGNGEQGILFNGGSPQVGCWPAGVYVISTNSTSLKAGIVTDQGVFEIVRINAVSTDQWTHVVLDYNGVQLMLSVNDDAGVSIIAVGATVRTRCNLYFGKSYDVNGNAHYFRGKLDTLSWYS